MQRSKQLAICTITAIIIQVFYYRLYVVVDHVCRHNRFDYGYYTLDIDVAHAYLVDFGCDNLAAVLE